MRTNIDIDDELMQQAIAATGATSKKAAVEASLRQTVQLKKQEGIRELFGKIEWEGDLDSLRQSRVLESKRAPGRQKDAGEHQAGKQEAASTRSGR